MAPVFLGPLVWFHALQYLCFLCMTVYIYMFGSFTCDRLGRTWNKQSDFSSLRPSCLFLSFSEGFVCYFLYSLIKVRNLRVKSEKIIRAGGQFIYLFIFLCVFLMLWGFLFKILRIKIWQIWGEKGNSQIKGTFFALNGKINTSKYKNQTLHRWPAVNSEIKCWN